MADHALSPSLIPIEAELQERMAWFIRLRWLAAGAIIVGAWFATLVVNIEVPPWPLTLVGATVLLYNLLFYFYRSRAESELGTLKMFIFVQIALDWIALLFVVHLLGGVRSPVALAFAFHLIIAAILLSRYSCYVLAGVASLMLGLVTILEEVLGVTLVESQLFLAGSLSSGRSAFLLWLIFTSFFLITAFLATSITTRLRKKEISLYNSQKALDRAYREMEALYQIGQVVNSTLDSKEVLETIAKDAASLLHTRACFIRLLEESENRLYIGGAFGLSQAYLNKGPVEVGKSLIDSEVLEGGTVQALEVSEDPRFQYRSEAREEGLHSVLCVPMIARGKVIGVMRVYSSQPRRFSKREVNLLKNLANLGAVAIQNARSYSELQELNEQRVWFARMTHHQLRAPLAAIQTTLDALPYAGELSEKQGELVQRAKRRISDSFTTIRDLLDLAAAQKPLRSDQPETIALEEAIETPVDTIRERAVSKQLSLEIDLPKEAIWIEIYPPDLHRIVLNLLENAVKYTPEGGAIRLAVTTDSSRITLKVEDTGIGIKADLQDRIFEGFFRSPQAKATGEMGTGLGLSIVKRLVERWKGEIEVESTVGKGSTFTVTLPIKSTSPE